MAFGGSFHGFVEGGGEIGVEINNSSDVVVELSDETHVSAEVVRNLGLVVLVYLVYQQPVLIQDVLHLNKVLLKCLQNFPIYLTTSISQP